MLGRLFGNKPVSSPIVLSQDDLFNLCRVERRRHAVSIMANVSDFIPMRTLVDEVTAREFGQGWTTDNRTTVYTTFYQQHIAVLENADVLSAPDGPSGTLYPGENAEPLAELITFIEAISD